jgi:hypothetical protein
MKKLLIVTTALVASLATAQADLIGTQVSSGFPFNANNVVISASQTEFTFMGGFGSVFTADFTGNSLDLKYVFPAYVEAGTFTFTFTDNAFAGLSIAETSDNFPSPGVTASLVGDLLTLNAPGTQFSTSGTQTLDAVFSIAPTADPAVGVPGPIVGAGFPGLVAAGLAAWGYFRRRRAA